MSTKTEELREKIAAELRVWSGAISEEHETNLARADRILFLLQHDQDVLRRFREENERLKSALQFYADQESWGSGSSLETYWVGSACLIAPISRDRGNVARAALSPSTESGKEGSNG